MTNQFLDFRIAQYDGVVVPAPPPPAGITILGITGEKRADGSVLAHIYWTHRGISIDREAFASVVTSIGRMRAPDECEYIYNPVTRKNELVCGGWKNYYTVETFPGIPPEGQIGVAGAYWAPEAVAQMPRGPAGFRSGVTIYLYWQVQAYSPLYVAENVISL